MNDKVGNKMMYEASFNRMAKDLSIILPLLRHQSNRTRCEYQIQSLGSET